MANKNSPRFKELRREVKKEIRESNNKKIEEEVTNTNGTYAWLKKIANLTNRVGDKSKVEIKLPEHFEKGLSELEQCEDIAMFISRISREYKPLAPDNLPHRVVHGLAHNPCEGHPLLDDHTVY